MTDAPPSSIPDAVEQEIDALRTIVAALDPLTPDARRRVILYMASVFSIEVPINFPPELSDGEIMSRGAAWASAVLDMLDPKQLEQQALDSLGLGGRQLGPAMFDAIKRAWREAAGTPEAVDAWPST